MKFTVILAFSWKVHVNGLFAVDKPNKETKLTNCYNKRYKKKYQPEHGFIEIKIF